MAETRREKRKVLGYPATIAAPGMPATSCVVMDVSNSGARLGIKNDVPDRFTLMLSANGASRDCEVMWRRNSEVGVKFTRRPVIESAPAAAPPEMPAETAVTSENETVLI